MNMEVTAMVDTMNKQHRINTNRFQICKFVNIFANYWIILYFLFNALAGKSVIHEFMIFHLLSVRSFAFFMLAFTEFVRQSKDWKKNMTFSHQKGVCSRYFFIFQRTFFIEWSQKAVLKRHEKCHMWKYNSWNNDALITESSIENSCVKYPKKYQQFFYCKFARKTYRKRAIQRKC